MASLNYLTETERDEIANVYDRWQRALNEKLYTSADMLAQSLRDAGMLPPEFTEWSVQHEAASHRAQRRDKRKLS